MHSFNAKSLRALVLVIAVALVGSGVLVYGQGTSGSLTGQISDSTGAAVVNATVTLKNVDTDFLQTATSDNTGVYLLKPVMPGNYSLTITAKGFAVYVQKGIVITANLYATQDVHLKVGSATSEVVTVTADTELVNTTSAELGSTVNEAAISGLPLDGRDPSSLVLLAAGTVNVLNHGGEGIQTGFSFPTETGASASGGRQGSTFYMLDGVTNMDNYNLLTSTFPNADATQEFKVITSNYGAQFGFAPGAVVSIATKSGTNTFHGGAFWYVRNNAMNATDWFSHSADTLRRNQYGFFAGGPIKKDKLFVFGNYQGTKIIWNSTDTLTTTPTAAMLTGDFSGLATAADLASGTTDLIGPFKTISGKPNQLDTSIAKLSPAALYFAKYGMIKGTNDGGQRHDSEARSANGRRRYDVHLSHRPQHLRRGHPQAGLQPLAFADPHPAFLYQRLRGSVDRRSRQHGERLQPLVVDCQLLAADVLLQQPAAAHLDDQSEDGQHHLGLHEPDERAQRRPGAGQRRQADVLLQ